MKQSLTYKQSGFSTVEGLLLVVIIAIIGFTGYYVWHSQKNANRLYIPTSTGNPTIKKGSATSSDISEKSTLTPYTSCLQSTGHTTDNISNYSGSLNICITKAGLHVTDSEAVPSVVMQPTPKFSQLSDNDLKNAIISNSTFKSSKCVQSGTLPDANITFKDYYVPGKFIDAFPNGEVCPSGGNGWGDILFANTSKGWIAIYDENNLSTNSLTCSLDDMYHIPTLLLIEDLYAAYCGISSNSGKNLYTGSVE